MRSPAEHRALERVLRGVAYAALVAFIAVIALRDGTRTVTASVAGLDATLMQSTADPGVARIRATFDTLPDTRRRDWLAALRRAGVRVDWTSRGPVPVAIETFSSPSPNGETIVLAAGKGDRPMIVGDAFGAIDTLGGSSIGATRVAGAGDVFVVSQAGQVARAVPSGHGASRSVIVAGPAGWETKFVVAALEEAGWTVHARIPVGPDKQIASGASALDTARQAAVIALDSASAESVAGLEAFARAGGGVILAGDAGRARAAAPLVAWRAGERQAAPIGVGVADTMWRGGSRIRLAADTSRAVILAGGFAAARRHYAGRVLALGYDATWRWRMAGGDSGVEAHRMWWSRAVASVARHEGSATVSGEAPLAATYDALGAPHADTERPPIVPPVPASLLGLIALLALLGEWWLRRSRGEV